MKLFSNNAAVFAESTFAEKDLCKALGLRWDRVMARKWAITLEDLRKMQVVQLSKMVQYAADEATQQLLADATMTKATAVEASRAVDSNLVIPAPAGLDYLPFQKGGIAFAAKRPGVLIADEMGLGKTIQALGMVNSDASIRTVMVICPASLKLNWAREAGKWLMSDCTITVHNADGTSKVKKTGDVNGVKVDIANYEAVRDREDLQNMKVDLLVVDEIHFCKNEKTQRAQAVKKVAAASRRRAGLTGTPVVNRPVELYPILNLVDPAQFPTEGFFKYAKRFCDAKQETFFVKGGRGKTKTVWNFKGSSNETELQEMLRGSVMVRRLKADVLKELPAKQRQVVVLPANGAAKKLAKQAAFIERIQAAKNFADAMALLEDDTAYAKAIEALENELTVAFTEMSALRHETALAKVPYAAQHVRDCLEDNTNKIVVMAHHHDVIEKLGEELADFGVVTVTGQTKVEDRQAAVDRFQTDPNCRVFIGNILAAGVGLTLTASSHVVFVELDWVPGNIKQCEDRVHRIGQRNSVLVQHLVFEDSIDLIFAETLVEKQRIIDLAMDAQHSESAAAQAIADAEAKARKAAVKAAAEAARPAMLQSRKDAIHTALRFLSARCDGAREEDGVGFNGRDTDFGKSLAHQATLSDRQAHAAAKMLITYRKTQLAELGGIVDTIWGAA